jgi:GMP synthase (glutamine-hydrolysing)
MNTMTKALYIVKVGKTFAQTYKAQGDFEDWIASGLRQADSGLPIVMIDLLQKDPLPSPALCAGLVITGSHAMVTEQADWSLKLEAWLRDAYQQHADSMALLGICYGHQVLAKALGGVVDFHPKGIELGRVAIDLNLLNATTDPLFASLPASFHAYVTHSQTVACLPPDAVHLAANPFESNHAFRLGKHWWGVQFHPEFTPAVMREYILAQQDALIKSGQDVNWVLAQVADCARSSELLPAFARYAAQLSNA